MYLISAYFILFTHEQWELLTLLQLFLSTEFFVLSSLWFRIFSTFVGLKSFLGFLSSFNPSFWKSEKRRKSSKTNIKQLWSNESISFCLRHTGKTEDTKQYQRAFIRRLVILPLFITSSQSTLFSLSLIRKTKLHSDKMYKCKSIIDFFSLSTSVCPDPGSWWCGSSVQWWWPAHPSASSLYLDPPDSSSCLCVQMMTMKVQHNEISFNKSAISIGFHW